MLWFWIPAIAAVALALLSLRGERKRAAYVAARLYETRPAPLPRATVIVPLKGHDEGLRENLAGLAALDYPDYELIVAAREPGDIPPGVLPSRVKVVFSHGVDRDASDKIGNLLAAVRASRAVSDVLAFADSDGRVGKGWLRALVEPLAEPGVGAATGYRWYTPQPPAFWPLVRSVWNAAAGGLLGPGNNPFAWGGAMAMRKETFFVVGVPQVWRNAVSDDYTLAQAVHAAGLTVAYAPGATVACPDGTTARAFFGWARRQMAITRAYSPRLWWGALAAHVVYCAGMAAAVTASVMGNRLAEWVLIAMLSAGMLKGANRAALAKAALPEWNSWFDRHGWVHSWWVPLVTWIWLAVLLSAAFTREIEWRGRLYRLPR